jgi:ATPase subunit of ABC transporter with duplicated ATPase domains
VDTSPHSDAGRASSADPAPPRARGVGARVEVRGLTKAYAHGGNQLTVLKGVDLSLAAGDMAAVVGASGVGKSTFLQILGTLDLPTSGSIKFDDEEITTMSPTRLSEFRNRKIGFVFQFHHLMPGLHRARERDDADAGDARAPLGRNHHARARIAGGGWPGKRLEGRTDRPSCRAVNSSAWPWRAR